MYITLEDFANFGFYKWRKVEFYVCEFRWEID